MKKGLLLIDGQKNSLFIQDEEIKELFEYLNLKKHLDKIKSHKKLAELDMEVRNYINGQGEYL